MACYTRWLLAAVGCCFRKPSDRENILPIRLCPKLKLHFRGTRHRQRRRGLEQKRLCAPPAGRAWRVWGKEGGHVFPRTCSGVRLHTGRPSWPACFTCVPEGQPALEALGRKVLVPKMRKTALGPAFSHEFGEGNVLLRSVSGTAPRSSTCGFPLPSLSHLRIPGSAGGVWCLPGPATGDRCTR